MSVWTHVSGVIRLDDYSFIKGKRNTKKDIEEIIGPMCLFHSWNSKTKLPCGSEGSLQYSIYESDNEAEIEDLQLCSGEIYEITTILTR